MISSHFLKKIHWNSSVFIYGAGATGKKLLHMLSSKRPDIKILGFLDTFKSGEFLGFPLYAAASFDSATDFDYILIASTDELRKIKGPTRMKCPRLAAI